LQVVDNQVDQTTGHRAHEGPRFANANLQLWPGRFVNVRVLTDTLKQVVIVHHSPRPALGPHMAPSPTSSRPDQRVALRPITVGLHDRDHGRHR